MAQLTRTGGFIATGVLGAVLLALIGLQGYRTVRPPVEDDFERNSIAVLSKPSAPEQAIAAQAKALSDREPLRGAGYVILGLIEEKAGRKVQAERLMAAASSVDRRDDVADLWLFANLTKTGHYDEGLLHADALLRRRDGQGEQLDPLILGMMGEPEALAALGRRLSSEPPWRSSFMSVAFRRLKSPAAGVAILDAIIKGGGVVNPEELAPVLTGLAASQQYEQAYLDWLLYSPKDVLAKVKNVVDGDFDSVPSARPFNWSQDTARFSVQDSSAYGRSGPALRLSYDGMGSSGILGQQLLVLPAGHYRLSGDVLTANTGSAGAIAWKVVCTDTTETPISTAPAPATGGGWKRFSADFDVTEACPAQWLRAMTTPNGTPVTIEVWYDKIAIDRLDQTS